MNLLIYIQIFLAVLLVVGILLQNTSAALGSAFGGGGGETESFHTRRGAEKTIFGATKIVAILFVVVSFSVFLLS